LNEMNTKCGHSCHPFITGVKKWNNCTLLGVKLVFACFNKKFENGIVWNTAHRFVKRICP